MEVPVMTKSLKYVLISVFIMLAMGALFVHSHNNDSIRYLKSFSANYVLNNRPVLYDDDYRVFDKCIQASLNKTYIRSDRFMQPDGFMMKTVNQESLQKALDLRIKNCMKNVDDTKSEDVQIKSFVQTLYRLTL